MNSHLYTFLFLYFLAAAAICRPEITPNLVQDGTSDASSRQQNEPSPDQQQPQPISDRRINLFVGSTALYDFCKGCQRGTDGLSSHNPFPSAINICMRTLLAGYLFSIPKNTMKDASMAGFVAYHFGSVVGLGLRCHAVGTL